MSNSRRYRRALARNVKPPAEVAKAAGQAHCPDCASEVVLRRDRAGIWHVAIRHDDECVQLAWRRRHGATTSAVLIAEPGRTLSPEAVKEVVEAMAERPGVKGVRVGFGPAGFATSGQERAATDDLYGDDQQPPAGAEEP